ncbi:MAG: hypothetical protein ACE5F6_16925 [Anaerolineae bacterium]
MPNSSDTPTTIYISAAPGLAAERDALARTIAELPVTLAWRIFQTPAATETLDREAVQTADLHLLVMGADIRAPVGLEWDNARRAGRPSVAFLKQSVVRTPAGQVFVNQAGVEWHRFIDAADLGRQVQRLLAGHLLRHATHYALTLTEVEQLEALRAIEAGQEAEELAAGEGADSSAVILSRERFVPREGVIVDDR